MRSTIRLGILWCSTEKFRLEPAAFIGTRRETLMFWEELQSEKAFRGQSLGLILVQECERQVIASKANKLFLAAQVRVKEFYEKQGYTAIGREFLEEYCPHIWMYKTLS